MILGEGGMRIRCFYLHIAYLRSAQLNLEVLYQLVRLLADVVASARLPTLAFVYLDFNKEEDT